jgi:hypothetical protein
VGGEKPQPILLNGTTEGASDVEDPFEIVCRSHATGPKLIVDILALQSRIAEAPPASFAASPGR